MDKTFTRRKLLAGVATCGGVLTGLRFVAGRAGPPPFTHYTYAGSESEGRFHIAWYEEYNGAFQEAQGPRETNATRALDPGVAPVYVDEPGGPIVTLDNVLPGDTGKLIVGLLVQEEASASQGLEISVNSTLLADEDNSVTEPERQAGDDTTGAAGGELADALEVTVWLDAGVMGLGRCDGRRLGEPTIASGSLREVCTALRDGRPVGGCLTVGDRRCLGVAWSLPETSGNIVQTDAVTFDLAFEARQCGGEP